MASAYSFSDVTIFYSEKELMNNVFLTISEGDRIGVVGRNGAGKSTFLRLLSGKEEPDHGEISVKRGMSVAYLPQTPVLREDDTITQAALDYLPARQGEDPSSAAYEAQTILTQLGFTDLNQPVRELSGGQKMRVALAGALCRKSDEEVVQNKYLELAGSPERIDMRSYERQGLDIIPTVHMGTAVSALERKGIATNIGNLNRDIKAANRMMNAIRSTIKNLRDWIADILEATKEVLAENEAEKKNVSPNLATLLRDYLNLRKAERSEWSRYGQQKGTTDDLKTISQATVYLQRHELFTLEDLDIALQGVSEKATAIREDMQKAANRMKAITAIQTAVADCEKHKAVHDKYIKIGWKIRKEAYAESHKDELTAFNKAYRTLKKHGADLNVDLKALQKEYDDLKISHTDLKAQLAEVNEELKPMKDIRYWVGKVLSPEQTIEKQPEPKHSLKERLQYEQEQKKKEQVQKAPKQKKQDMEL